MQALFAQLTCCMCIPDMATCLHDDQAGSLYDCMFDKASCSWAPWLPPGPPAPIPTSLAFNDIMVPTVDSVRYGRLLQLLAAHNKHVLFVGPTGVALAGQACLLSSCLQRAQACMMADFIAESIGACICILHAGTGKTAYVKAALEGLAAKGGWHVIPTAFSAQTSANQVAGGARVAGVELTLEHNALSLSLCLSLSLHTSSVSVSQNCHPRLSPATQHVKTHTAHSSTLPNAQVQDMVDAKLDKRRKGVYGPPLGSAAVLFVDDLNMPALEVYGAQPPVELLRQLVDHGGWCAAGWQLRGRDMQCVDLLPGTRSDCCARRAARSMRACFTATCNCARNMQSHAGTTAPTTAGARSWTCSWWARWARPAAAATPSARACCATSWCWRWTSLTAQATRAFTPPSATGARGDGACLGSSLHWRHLDGPLVPPRGCSAAVTAW